MMKHYETPNATMIVLSEDSILTLIAASGEANFDNITEGRSPYSSFFPSH